MDAELTITKRPLGRAGRAAARYRTTRAETEPLVALLVDLAALGALLYRHGTNAWTRTQTGGEG
jgi:hypothetical protein